MTRLKDSTQPECSNLEQLKARVIELESYLESHKSTVKALKKSENVMRSIYRVAPTGIGMLKNRVFTEVNPLVCEMSAYTKEELIGQNARILYLSDEDYNYVGEEKYRQIKEHGTGTVETRWKRKDNVVIEVLLSSTPIEPNNLAEGVIFTALDITERIRAEEEMARSEERMKVIFEFAPDMIFIIDLYGNILDGNKAAEELVGYKREDLIGENILKFNLVSRKNIPTVTKTLAQSASGLKTGPNKFSLKTKTGIFVPVEITTYPVNLGGRNVVLGIGRDLTQRIKAEEKLRDNEQRMSLHFHQSPLGVIEWDLNFKVKTWNPAAREIFGYTEEEALGKHASFIIPDSMQSHVDQVWMELLMLKGGGRSTNRNIRKNGEIVLCDWYNTPLKDENGKVVSAASLVQNITKRKRAEQIQTVLYNISNAANSSENLKKLIGQIQEELSSIIDTRNFFVALHDPKTDTVSLPFFADEMDEFKSMPAGKTLTGHVIHTKKSLLATAEVIQNLEEKGLIESVGTDSEIWLGVPLIVEDNVIGALAVQSYTNKNAFTEADMKMLEFVSEQIGLAIYRKKTEVELKKALGKAKESDKLKSAFLANMSHEIRTPVNGILGFAELLKNPDLSTQQQQQFVEIIEKSGNRMLSIINDLIDISKIESGQTEVILSEVRLNETIRYIKSFFQHEAQAKGIDIEFETTLSDELATIKSDKEMIYAILTNLVKNAIKYSEKGKINFGYKLQDNMLNFYVRDTGIGIPKDRLHAVFNRFVQVHSELSGNYEGAGLGLSITKAYVELLGGKINVESEFGVGSVFHFSIPYNHLPSVANNKADAGLHKTNNVSLKKIKIILAEDDEILKKYTAYTLKEVADLLIVTSNGLETIKALKENPDVELVLMDIKMPEMNGLDATREIRKFNKDVIIIAQTAFALESDRENALEAGCNDYVSKPINRKLLMEKIGQYFQI